MKRRRFLLAGGSSLTVLLASCTGQRGEGIESDGFRSVLNVFAGGDDASGEGRASVGGSDPSEGGADDEGDPEDGGDPESDSANDADDEDDETDGSDDTDDSDDGDDESDDDGSDDGDENDESGGDDESSDDDESGGDEESDENDDGDDGDESGGDGADGPIPGFSQSTAEAELEAGDVGAERFEREGEYAGIGVVSTAQGESEGKEDIRTVLEAISAAIVDPDVLEADIEGLEVRVFDENGNRLDRFTFPPGIPIDYLDGEITLEEYVEQVLDPMARDDFEM